MLRTILAATFALAIATAVQAGEQDAIDGCIDRVRAEAGGGGGQVLSADDMGANWYVHLEDASGGEWDCYAADDGSVTQLTWVTPIGAKGGPETKEARRACRRALRQEAGHGGIEVESAEVSEANTLVMLSKEGAGEWRCLSSSNGEVAELTRVGGSAGSTSGAEADCLAAVGEQVGGRRGLSVQESSMGETFTTVIVNVPQAERPWACEWGGNGVQRVYYMGEG